jgi:hypothetical protein
VPSPMNQACAQQAFDYNPESGLLTWRVGTRGHREGAVAGSPVKRRLTVNFRHQTYAVHHIIWVWMTGYWPKGEPNEVVDHINRNPYDNRWSNLRLVTQQQNTWNTKELRSNNTSSVQGVSIDLRQNLPYVAIITVSGKNIRLGSFATLEEARAAREEAVKKYYGEFAPK